MTHSSITTSSSSTVLRGGSTKPLRILHVLPEFPYPPLHGGRMDVWRRICDLSRLGHRTHLVVTVNSMPDPPLLREVAARVERLDLVPRRRSPWAAAGADPYQVASRSGLAHAPLLDEYDVALLEQESVAAILRNRRLHARKLIVRVHND